MNVLENISVLNIENMILPSKRKTLVSLSLSGSLMLLLLYQFNQWFLAQDALQNKKYNKSHCSVNYLRTDRSMKYILQWTKQNTEPFIFWGQGQEQFIKRKCKINNCYVTANRLHFPCLSGFDAIAFHGPEISRVKYLPGPNIRSPYQKYVFVSRESSHYYPICDERYDGYFNWTWTYKLDSDEAYAYLTVRNLKGDIIGPNKDMHWIKHDSMKPIDNTTKARLDRKNKAAAWFVSNCNSLSKREKFVNQLQKELNKYDLKIDIFGTCSWANKQCLKTNVKKCLNIIQKHYYFYLSLENSFSEDYVTEKLLTALQNYAVPVVFGGANYEYTRFMPDGIYLHGGKMKLEDLAKEMNDIIIDTERYYSFFKWRNHYSYHARSESPDSDDLCRWCEMLNDETMMAKKTTYTDFRTWWNVPGKCK